MSTKTVYISYVPSRSLYIAQPLFNGLIRLEYDVFMDIDEDIAPASLRQVAAREHFVMILAPGVLDRAGAKDDRLTLDFEEAVRHKRNMVLLLTRDFYFDRELGAVSGVMSHLPRIKSLRVNPNHMKSIINILDTEFFIKRAAAPPTPTPPEDEPYVQRKIAAVRDYAKQTTIRQNTEKLLFRAVQRIHRGHHEDALQDLDIVISDSPKNENAYLQRAILQQKMGRFTAALRDYEKAVQISPKMVNAHVGRGQLLLVMGRSQQALKAFMMGLRVEKDSSVALAGAALANQSLGNAEEATRQWKELIARDANYADPAWTQKRFGWDDELTQRMSNLVKQL